jgi:cobyrinic acid a,c-diamide synthase
MAQFFISAARKSSGKTTVSIGLAAALTSRGLRVQAFKKGPDYIDPMWLARASGRPCYNLDFNTQTEAEISHLFARHSGRADIALIEGNKGLHDGVDIEGRDSSGALAKLIGAPVILVIDTTGFTRGIAPLLLGNQNFDRDVRIAGVILNGLVSARQESKLRQAIERYTDLPIVGAIGRDSGLAVKERHLGLTTPSEVGSLDGIVGRLRATVAQGVDLDRVLSVAQAAATPSFCEPAAPSIAPDVRIAIARDTAFGFYYPDDLEALQQAGAELVFFNALRDAQLPPADALFIGGGFPETQMEALAANKSLRAQIRRAAELGMPIYAECGGLMYLTRSITWGAETHEMVGFIPADTLMRARPQGRGLVALEETAAALWAPLDGTPRIAAHEFHHAALENLDPATRFAYRVLRGRGTTGQHDGIVKGNVLASFSHLRSTAGGGAWAQRFVAFVRARTQTARSRIA